ncbi:bifunctional diaminohydroxyphosphoribosylaminopyrimidine deaminase/5-amino-6-(5-phosphoribosylamino)uracil reductase RibD [Acuticoccus sp. MNP-M23]|uniref:bifunctional diaminohydroxyphosphoribosylaminopyrimidine deaminase/5-amino-6-(5-phosphoribosylamino)uracil reductase RibD n=1 Tax=Acuticoccus sp. MNP-M23 TaxID=3072793 RepID=UPI002814A8E8|nr:bifunctional diaminohydroxyphosphoribosylaminopyrimidine deaminase/5-amino-6-(5-phosphoribosylamino)uracil reductase RibD [Acuticoccus sp. MNP-M23]WMS43354.1 bifunctional diaminohydroxyphosphoribosylaminopyrimidine deaminase/5-amino-6-(5-phosphoribosylamino)uracil reductase RibD [Acuticoccus sp. MNP-M23]
MTDPFQPADPRATDRRFMAAAIALARQGVGRTRPNPSVGAVLVQHTPSGPVVVGAGRTADGGRPHAERQALAQAGAAARGATCYCTLEPCSHFGRTSPCADALIEAGVAAVVVACVDPNPAVAGEGLVRLRNAGISVRQGVRTEEAATTLSGHMSRMVRGRPHVALKLALSADGAIGRRGEGGIAITGPAWGRQTHLLRAAHDAIAVGIGTVLADDPSLTCRLPGMAARSPDRIILDTDARTPTNARLFADRKVPVLIFVALDADPARCEALQAAGAVLLAVPRAGAGLDLAAALGMLSERGIGSVLVEGGAGIAEALAAADLIDEAWLVRAPHLLGGDLVRPFGGDPVAALSENLVIDARDVAGSDFLTHMKRTCSQASSQT